MAVAPEIGNQHHAAISGDRCDGRAHISAPGSEPGGPNVAGQARPAPQERTRIADEALRRSRRP